MKAATTVPLEARRLLSCAGPHQSPKWIPKLIDEVKAQHRKHPAAAWAGTFFQAEYPHATRK